MQVWINGSLLNDPGAPAVSISDHGFTVGDGVFEAIKVIAGEPFALTRHVARLARSAAALGLPPIDEAVVREGVAAVLHGFEESLGRLRALAGVKSTSYAENVVALAFAEERGATEAIFGNLKGDLCEGTGSNVFYVIDGELRTPSLAAGCLAGITRALIVEWCGALEVDEPMAMVGEQAEEIFLASTTRDAQAVVRWDDRALVGPGPVTAAVQEEWRRRELEHLDP
jgi:branched-chain amino acid aminotransferase